MKDHNLFIHSTLDVFGKLWISPGPIDAQGGSPVCAAPHPPTPEPLCALPQLQISTIHG